MNRGRARAPNSHSSLRGRGSPRPGAYYAPVRGPVGADEHFGDDSFGSEDRIPQGRGRNSQQRSLGYNSKHSDYKPKSSYVYQPRMPSPLTPKETVTQIGTFHPGKNSAEARDSASKQSDSANENDLPSLSAHSDSYSKEDVHLDVRKSPTSQTPVEGADFPDKVNISILQDESQLPSKFGSKAGIVQNQGTRGTAGNKDLEHSECSAGLQQRSLDNNSKHSDYIPKSSYAYQPKRPSPVTTKETVSQIGTFHQGKNSAEVRGSASKQSDSARENDLPSLSAHSDSKEDVHMEVRKSPTSQTPVEGANFPDKVNISSLQGESQLTSKFGSKARVVQNQGTKSTAGNKDLQHSERSAGLEPFDICPTKSETLVVLKPSLLVRNREKRNELSMQGQNGSILRPGMVILKSYISPGDQVKIVKVCRDLGFGSGGFYQPGYRDGAKLHLKMMCLGKNWDPETSEYGDHRPIDDTIPPAIPDEFYQLVESAIKDSHALIKRDSKVSNVEDILPWMSPSICIVNFYSASGKLGLHQDRDESPESLRKRLPVVSFSIGDKAEFLYGDQRDPDKADKVELASGDVLIFGGKSRHVFHGVTAILPNTAPKVLLEDTELRPGRLNLTFRQF